MPQRSNCSSLVVMYPPSAGAQGEGRNWGTRLETPVCAKRLKPVADTDDGLDDVRSDGPVQSSGP
jgi:hypothetical protein